MQLQLVVADFHWDAGEFSATAARALPRLPGLEAVLRHASRASGRGGWREEVARLAGRRELANVPPARIASLALASEGLPNPWLATPVHQSAGLDHLRLHAAGLLRLQPAELEELAGEFARAFAGSGLQLMPLFGGFVLQGLAATDAVTQDPARFLGADLLQAPPTGPQAGVLRRLGAELEMWLHALPLNPARARRGQLAVTSLWLWGGGPAPALALRQRLDSLPQVYADDAYVAGLWHGSGGEARALPASLEAVLAEAAAPSQAATVVVVSTAARSGRDAPMLRLDEQWLQPALAALAARRIDSLQLKLGSHWLLLKPPHRLRFWRRARPWWEVLQA